VSALVRSILPVALGCESPAYVMWSKAQLRETPAEACVGAALERFGSVEYPEPRVKGKVSYVIVRSSDRSRYSLQIFDNGIEVSWGTFHGPDGDSGGLTRVRARQAETITAISTLCGSGVASVVTCVYEAGRSSEPRKCP